MNKKAVIFDMDGTLTEHNAWLNFTKALGASVEEHTKIYNDLLSGTVGLAESKQKLVALWQKTGNTTREQINRIYDSWSLHHDAMNVVKTLQDRGYKTCIITGSVQQYAEYVAHKLAIDDVYASAKLKYNDNDQLIDFEYSINQSTVKLQQLTDYCEKYELNFSDCIVVGDGDNDMDIFTATGRGIYLDTPYSSEKLKSVAWKTATDLSQVLEII